MYNEIAPMLDMTKKMIENEADKARLLQFIDSTFPQIKLNVLTADMKACTACELFPCNHVLPEGNANCEIMFIAEAPGDQEEKTGKPLQGPAGTMFDNMLNSASQSINDRWNRDNVYITHVVKCKPVNENKAIRTPDIKEIAACKRFLDREIAIVKPKVIICLGTVAANTIIHPNFNLEEEHGKLFGDETKLMAIYHPNYILHKGEQTKEGIDLKLGMWNDLIIANTYLDTINGAPAPLPE